TAYLRGEQQLGRIDAGADIGAAASLIIGAIHGQVLPRVLLNPPGSQIATEPGLAARLPATGLPGIAPSPHPEPPSRPPRRTSWLWQPRHSFAMPGSGVLTLAVQ